MHHAQFQAAVCAWVSIYSVDIIDPLLNNKQHNVMYSWFHSIWIRLSVSVHACMCWQVSAVDSRILDVLNAVTVFWANSQHKRLLIDVGSPDSCNCNWSIKVILTTLEEQAMLLWVWVVLRLVNWAWFTYYIKDEGIIKELAVYAWKLRMDGNVILLLTHSRNTGMNNIMRWIQW